MKVGSEVITDKGWGHVTEIRDDGQCWVELTDDSGEYLFVTALIQVIDGDPQKED